MRKIISALLVFTMVLTLFTVNVFAADVEAPTANPAGGIYGSPQEVALSSSTQGASIYYTTDGSTPTTSGTLYTSPIHVDTSMQIKAIGVANDMNNSTTAVFDYVITSDGKTHKLVYNPVEDTFVNNALPDSINGTQTGIHVLDAPDATDRRAFLKFDLGNIGISECSSATLKLCLGSGSDGSVKPVKIFSVSDDSWTETGMTWNNQPVTVSQIVYDYVQYNLTFYSFDVTPYVSSELAGNKTVSLCILDDTGANGVLNFNSKEGTFKPELEVVTPAALTGNGTGVVSREYWSGITGSTVSSLTGNSNYPDNPSEKDTLNRLEVAHSQDDNYGERLRAYIVPPATGNYTFWIASNNASELWLSTNADPVNKARIAKVSSDTRLRQWDKAENEQKSAQISLVAGQQYYVEVLHKASTGIDNVSVAWQIPGNEEKEVIDSQYLSPYDTNYEKATKTLLNPVADSFVNNAMPTANSGSGNTMSIVDAPDATDRQAYLKFDLSSISAESCNSATLKLFLYTSGANGSLRTVKIKSVADDTWTESGITWNNKPAAGTQVSYGNVIYNGQWYNFDLTAYTAAELAGDKTLSICLMDDSGSNTILSFYTRETSYKPELEVITPTQVEGAGAGLAKREYWNNVTGTQVSSVTNSAYYPSNPNGCDYFNRLEMVHDFGDNYGQRISGYLYAPISGGYQFAVSGDESCELWLSSDSTRKNKSMIAKLSTRSTRLRQFDAYSEQASGTVTLTAGKYYYFEILHKEGTLYDHISAGWKMPGSSEYEIIDGKFLSPAYDGSYGIEKDMVPHVGSWTYNYGTWETAGQELAGGWYLRSKNKYDLSKLKFTINKSSTDGTIFIYTTSWQIALHEDRVSVKYVKKPTAYTNYANTAFRTISFPAGQPHDFELDLDGQYLVVKWDGNQILRWNSATDEWGSRLSTKYPSQVQQVQYWQGFTASDFRGQNEMLVLQALNTGASFSNFTVKGMDSLDAASDFASDGGTDPYASAYFYDEPVYTADDVKASTFYMDPALWGTAQPFDGHNVIANPHFDTNEASRNKPIYWWSVADLRSTYNPASLSVYNILPGTGSYCYDAVEGHTSPGSMRIENTASDFGITCSSNQIDYMKRQTFSFWAKTESAAGSVYPEIYWYAADTLNYTSKLRYISKSTGTASLTGTNGWTKLDVTAMPPFGASHALLVVRAEGNSSGNVWVDDAEFNGYGSQPLEVTYSFAGYTPRSDKQFVIKSFADQAPQWELKDSQDATVSVGTAVYSAYEWYSNRYYYTADLTGFTTPGTYTLRVTQGTNTAATEPFKIDDNIYKDIAGTALYGLYFKRYNTYIPEAQEAESLEDAQAILIHDSAHNKDERKDLLGGWYDAGDMMKHVEFWPAVLFAADNLYENMTALTDRTDNDALDELMWGLNSFYKFEDEQTGTFYYSVKPQNGSQDNIPFYLQDRFAATEKQSSMSQAAGVCAAAALAVQNINPALSDLYKDLAIRNYNFNMNQFNEKFPNPTPYEEFVYSSKFLFAEIYLWELTGDSQYKTKMDEHLLIVTNGLKNGLYVDSYETVWGANTYAPIMQDFVWGPAIFLQKYPGDALSNTVKEALMDFVDNVERVSGNSPWGQAKAINDKNSSAAPADYPGNIYERPIGYWTGLAYSLSQIGIALNDINIVRMAERQLQWTLGKNMGDFSCIDGIGSRWLAGGDTLYAKGEYMDSWLNSSRTTTGYAGLNAKTAFREPGNGTVIFTTNVSGSVLDLPITGSPQGYLPYMLQGDYAVDAGKAENYLPHQAQMILAISGVNEAYDRLSAVPEKVKTPTASIKPGQYDDVQTVSLSTSTPGAGIYYTEDGSTPTVNSIPYASPINVDSQVTIKAIAVKTGMSDSNVEVFDYTVEASTPVSSPAPGSYDTALSVTLSSMTGNAAIYYTTDGSIPTTSSTLYSSAIPLSSSTTIKAIAVKPGIQASSVGVSEFKIEAQVPVPDVQQGPYASAQVVSLSSETPGSSIYYTLDGSDPTTSSLLFTAPIPVNYTLTVKAIAVKSGIANSPVAEMKYIITTGGGPYTLAYNPVDDSFVRAVTYGDTNFGMDPSLLVKDSPTNYFDRMIYLKFDLSSIAMNTCSSAVLTLYCKNWSLYGNPAKIFAVSDDTWTETGLTWNNKPATAGQIAILPVSGDNTYYNVDLTNYVSSELNGNKIVTICILDDTSCDQLFEFDSKEGTNKPVLEVTVP